MILAESDPVLPVISPVISSFLRFLCRKPRSGISICIEPIGVHGWSNFVCRRGNRFLGVRQVGHFSLSVTLGDTQAIALIDYGSTNNFLDKQFALKHRLPIQEVPARMVRVAGGGRLISDAIFPQCSYSIQNKKFSSDFKILPLKGYDIVLGVPCLKKYNPTTIDWIERKLTITDQGLSYTFTDHQSLPADCTISATQCLSLLSKGASGFLLQLYNLQENAHVAETIPSSVPTTIQRVLQEFSDVFSIPQGLPPPRSCDHQIVLTEGAKRPNIRPYRMPHHQKNVIEELIQQMLQTQEIRPSTSPFSSLAILVRKKDNTWRLCVDYRQLNAITVKNKYPIPVIEDLLDELQGTAIFSKLDLRSGYHQILMSPQDITKTAFRTHMGHY